VQACSAPVSESSVVNIGLASQSHRLGAPSGIPLPTSVGPLDFPMGPEIVAAPQPKVSLNLGQSVYTAGTRPVGPQVNTIGHLSTPQLPVGMAIQPAQAYQSLAPPLVPTSVLGSTLLTPVVPTCVLSTPLTNVAIAMPSTSIGADTRPTYVSLGVPLTSVSPLVSTKDVPSVVTTATAPPPLPPCVSGSRDWRSNTVLGYGKFCCWSARTDCDNQAARTCPPLHRTDVVQIVQGIFRAYLFVQ